MVSTGSYPETIPSGTRVPHWAYLDPTQTDDFFNATIAQNTGGTFSTPARLSTDDLTSLVRFQIVPRAPKLLDQHHHLQLRPVQAPLQALEVPKLALRPLPPTPAVVPEAAAVAAMVVGFAL